MATWPDILMRLSFDEDLDAADTAWMLDEVFKAVPPTLNLAPS